MAAKKKGAPAKKGGGELIISTSRTKAAAKKCTVGSEFYGALDQGIPVADVEAMNAALKVAKKPSSIHLYPQADHGFLADYRPSYRAPAAQDGWQRLLAWLKQNGVA